LDDLVGKYALISAFQDYRFSKISIKEVKDLSCSVSLLTNFEETKDAYDWEIGKHGIQIKFSPKGGQTYGGTFLPEVAKEQEWDHETTLAYLIKKAGFTGDYKTVLKEIQTTRYQSTKVCISYEEYAEMRKDSPFLNFNV
jgi:uncharacterized protein (TIGR00296 family)